MPDYLPREEAALVVWFADHAAGVSTHGVTVGFSAGEIAQAATDAALQPPGQARTLEAPRQAEGWVFLDWKEPAGGGAVASYKIERRERPVGPWMLVGVALQSEATLNNQERGKDWEYRVIAVNKAGEGAPSNTAAAVV